MCTTIWSRDLCARFPIRPHVNKHHNIDFFSTKRPQPPDPGSLLWTLLRNRRFSPPCRRSAKTTVRVLPKLPVLAFSKTPILTTSTGAISSLEPISESKNGLIAGLPMKPLSFPRNDREFNSSSDTYTSENTSKPETSFERNFSLDDDPNLLTKTVHTHKILVDDEEFLFVDSQTPLTSQTDLSRPVEDHHIMTVLDIRLASPTRSIMKKTPTGSPTKSSLRKTPTGLPKKVGFTQNPQVHTFDEKRQELDVSESQDDRLPHLWTEVDHELLDSLPPPPAPPHTTYSDILQQPLQPDMDLEALSAFRLEHKSFSNLLLNEKLDVYLGKSTENDLDTHLTQIDQDIRALADTNIHRMSLNLQTPALELENPLNSLSRLLEVQLRLAGLLQLSLQSLVADNRTLQLEGYGGSNRGIELNDGIKGFPDHLVESLIPRTNERPVFDIHPSDSELDEPNYHDSFDNNTAQLIMNLLNASAANLGAAVRQNDPKDASESENTVSEPKEAIPVAPESVAEVNSVPLDPVVKEEDVEVSIKDESDVSHAVIKTDPPHDNLVKEEHHDFGYDSDTKLENASYGIPLDQKSVKLVQTDLPETSINHADMTAISAFSIRDHVDSDWKFEDSNDGDREDNDDYTHNDQTSIHQVLGNEDISPSGTTDNHLSTSNFDVDHLLPSGLLEVNLSPNTSQEMAHLVHSLAPPRNEETLETPEKVAEVPGGPAEAGVTVEASAIHMSPKEAPKTVDLTVEHEGERLGVSENVPESLERYQEDSNALANSSNIAPPDDMTLPIIDPSKFSPLLAPEAPEDLFEESLSAEHDADGKPTNFISIWHSQERLKKLLPTKNSDYKFAPILDYHSPDLGKIPTALQTKKFKEVNVMLRRVVSPGEDLNVSGFLPEISEDSGFSALRLLVKNDKTERNDQSNYLNVSGNRLSFTPLSTKNVLSNIDNNPSVIEPPAPGPLRPARHSSGPDFAAYYRLRHKNETEPKTESASKVRKSRFKVPSFEIKRSNSILLPRNQYNDIFNDGISHAPTIRAHGMKTLPSMDRDDVRRILDTKRVISQEEYSKIKLVGNSKKNLIVDEPNHFDRLQQLALIHDASFELLPPEPALMAHLADELTRDPTALLSKDQLFNDYDLFAPHVNALYDNNSEGLRTSLVVLTRKQDPMATFPEPDPELINLPDRYPLLNIFKTPPQGRVEPPDMDDDTFEAENLPKTVPVPQNGAKMTKTLVILPSDAHNGPTDAEAAADLAMKYRIINGTKMSQPTSPTTARSGNFNVKKPEVAPTTPRAKKAQPIKIGSPIKLVKNGLAITGITLDSPKKASGVKKLSFSGIEVPNAKVRDAPVPQDASQHIPSTVSVPSNVTHSLQGSQATLLDRNGHDYRVISQHRPHRAQQEQVEEPQGLGERGRLFLRVIGLKNIELPDIEGHSADFSIFLDNGVHCIKTPSYRLDGQSVSIGKEFELTVGESLEFILTMKATYSKPRERLVEVKESRVVQLKNRISRIFGSKNIVTTTRVVPQKADDPWEHKFAQDGSFARCYVDLDQYEHKVTGRATTFNITCFNEWETVAGPNGDPVRAQPYRIGQLEVKMLFIPRVDAGEILPTSIRLAYDSIDDLRQEGNTRFDGYLHQEGGDCDIWKKRYFKLEGTSLVAHSEYSHKTRAKINLAKIVDVIYVDKENARTASAYRNFSDILLVEHAFKIKFANGEMIDFGAPNGAEKKQWIALLEKIVYRNKFRRQPWVKLMMLEAQTWGDVPVASRQVTV